MKREIEIKLRINDPAAVRRRLSATRAVAEGEVFEVNRIFDTSDASLRKAGRVLRLRELTPVAPAGAKSAVLTLKSEAPTESAAVKTRLETQTIVSDGSAAVQILAGLGLIQRFAYEKRRWTWVLGEALITLDEIPRLGWYVEIEAPSAARVHAVADELALSGAAVVHESYIALAAAHGTPCADGCIELRFA